MLAARVEAGDLPELEERLPTNPLVVEPLDRVGQYGGEWHLPTTDPRGGSWLSRTAAYENLVRWKTDTVDFSLDDVLPNIAETFEFNDDRTEYTFTLREGMRWSDGHEFTVDDVEFSVNDVILNEELYPAGPSYWSGLQTRNGPGRFEKIDDRTFTITFPATHAFFLQLQATPQGFELMRYPRHYLEQFHPKYNSDVDMLAANEGFETWVQLFPSKADATSATNPDLPVLSAWRLVTPANDVSNRISLERNPYYWKVDRQGRQLPYIDQVTYSVIEGEVILLQMTNGDIDIMDPFEVELHDKPVLAQHRDRGNYRFVDTFPSWMNTMMLALNLATEDPVKHEVFNNKDFRIGLSHAINREEIIDVVYKRQGEAWQGAPRPESSFYDEQMAKQYTEYDVGIANEHLDRVLPSKDTDGARLTSGDDPFSLQVDVSTSLRPDWVDSLELVRQSWRQVGIDMHINGMHRSLFEERKAANLQDATVWYGDGGLEVFLEPRWYFPFSFASDFAIPWATWFNNPDDEAAIEPPPAAREQMDLYRKIETTADPAEQTTIMEHLLQIAKEQFWAMGISMLPEMYVPISNKLQNIPERLTNAWLYATPGPSNPEQYFISR